MSDRKAEIVSAIGEHLQAILNLVIEAKRLGMSGNDMADQLAPIVRAMEAFSDDF